MFSKTGVGGQVYPFLPWMKSYHDARKKHPHMFWGFANIRRAIHMCGQPFMGDTRKALTAGPVVTALSELPSAGSETDFRSLAQNYLMSVIGHCILRAQVRCLIAEDALRCPLATGTPIFCPDARPDCSRDIATLSASGHKCLFISFFQQFFDMMPHRLSSTS